MSRHGPGRDGGTQVEVDTSDMGPVTTVIAYFTIIPAAFLFKWTIVKPMEYIGSFGGRR